MNIGAIVAIVVVLVILAVVLAVSTSRRRAASGVPDTSAPPVGAPEPGETRRVTVVEETRR